MRLMLAATVCGLITMPAVAQDNGPNSAAPAPEKRICRSVVLTGTIMSKKTCRSRTQWAALDAASERASQIRRNVNTLDRPQGGAGGQRDTFGQ